MKRKNPSSVPCECGWVVRGNSIVNAGANLILHKKSKLHKKLMEMRATEKKQ